MDLRAQKTQKSIAEAFYRLRAHKPLEKITVRELCREAPVNRSTFYAYYKDVYDLSEQLENELVHPAFEVSLSFRIYGSYYAFLENRQYGEEKVVEILGRLSSGQPL